MIFSRIVLLGLVLSVNLAILPSSAVPCQAGSQNQVDDASSKPKVLTAEEPVRPFCRSMKITRGNSCSSSGSGLSGSPN